MSLIDRFKSDPAAADAKIPPMISPKIAADLQQAEAALATLQARYDGAALSAALNEPGASGVLADLLAGIATARDRVTALTAAHRAALTRDEASARQARALIQKTQINAVKSHLQRRDKAAERLAKLLEEAMAEWKLLTVHSEKAKLANPIGGEWPDGGCNGLGEVRRLVEQELFRLGNETVVSGRTFPGAKVYHHDLDNNPPAVPPLADVLRKASEHVMAVLTGRPLG